MKTPSPLQNARNGATARLILCDDEMVDGLKTFNAAIEYIDDHKRDEHSLITMYADDETLDDATARLEELLDDIDSERAQESIQDKLDAGKLYQAYVHYRKTIDRQERI